MATSSVSANMNVDENWERRDWFDIEEQIYDYYPEPGGLHPVNIGDVYNSRYLIAHSLGSGGLSTTWLAKDKITDKFVALKILRADTQDREYDVAKHMADEFDSRLFPAPMDRLTIHGINGTHDCIAMELARESLFDVLDCVYDGFGPMPLDMSRYVIGQILQAVKLLHHAGKVHMDIHAGNILFKLPESIQRMSIEELYAVYGRPVGRPASTFHDLPDDLNPPDHLIMPICFRKFDEPIRADQAEIVLADFGEAFAPALESKFESNTLRTGQPPESFFQVDGSLSFAADIWALGTVIYHILGCMHAFQVLHSDVDSTIEEHMNKLGPLPKDWWESWDNRSNFFNEDMSTKSKWPIETLAGRFQEGMDHRRNRGGKVMEPEEIESCFEVLTSMFRFKPEERATISEVLGSEWVIKWVLPETLQQEVTVMKAIPAVEPIKTCKESVQVANATNLAADERESPHGHCSRIVSLEVHQILDHSLTTNSHDDAKSSRKREVLSIVSTASRKNSSEVPVNGQNSATWPVRSHEQENQKDRQHKQRDMPELPVLNFAMMQELNRETKDKLNKGPEDCVSSNSRGIVAGKRKAPTSTSSIKCYASGIEWLRQSILGILSWLGWAQSDI